MNRLTDKMKLTFLGTGTSTGVPVIRCECATCRSRDEHDKRLRSSVMVTYKGKNLLIDCGPDFREQMLRQNSPNLEALLITHSHYDHVGGVDDLRPYCALGDSFPLYCRHDVAEDLRARVPYCFAEAPYPGVPAFTITEITNRPLRVADIDIVPLEVMHHSLPIIGFKIGNLAYITDAKTIPECTLQIIRGIDTLVINALRFKEHHSHLSLEQALKVIEEVKPRVAYLTHMSHDIGPAAETALRLPEGVKLAYDGLVIHIPDPE